MISSRVAEPETADMWATKMIQFSENYAQNIATAIELINLSKKQVVRQLNKLSSADNNKLKSRTFGK